MDKKTYRIPAKLSEKITEDVKQENYPSENEYVIAALEHFLKCKKVEVLQGFKEIIFRYPAKCIGPNCERPDREIKIGEWGLWGRGQGAICMDCYVKRIGDKTLVHKFMKVKELQRLEKAIIKVCNEKAEELREFNFYEILQEMYSGDVELRKLLMAYLKTGFEKPEDEKRVLDEVDRLIEKLYHLINDAQEFMKVPLKKNKREKKAYQ